MWKTAYGCTIECIVSEADFTDSWWITEPCRFRIGNRISTSKTNVPFGKHYTQIFSILSEKLLKFSKNFISFHFISLEMGSRTSQNSCNKCTTMLRALWQMHKNRYCKFNFKLKKPLSWTWTETNEVTNLNSIIRVCVAKFPWTGQNVGIDRANGGYHATNQSIYRITLKWFRQFELGNADAMNSYRSPKNRKYWFN